MVQYNLSHLTQENNQSVVGPIQDDEALFLYGMIKTTRIKTIVEIGAGQKYSTRNFLSAIDSDGKVFSIDIVYPETIADNHIFIHKSVSDVLPSDILNTSIDMIFFDCHHYDGQILFYNRMLEAGLITDKTMLVFHDTNLHPKKMNSEGCYTENGWAHQPVERKMVNYFVERNYHAICFHTDLSVHNDNFPFRHGITIASKFKELKC